MTVPIRTKQVRMNPLAFAILIEAIAERPRTKPALAELTGLHVWTVRHYIDALHRRKQVHIVRWDKDAIGRDTTPYYSLGFGIDVPRAAKSGAQKARERRARIKKETMGITTGATA